MAKTKTSEQKKKKKKKKTQTILIKHLALKAMIYAIGFK